MAAEAVTKKLYDAATMGDVATFQTLVQQDPFLVDQVSFARSRNLLHIATMAGQVGIVEELLRRNTELARDVDSKNSSSLHIAAARGHVDIVVKLFSVAPEICWWLDDQGMNPVHIAAMKGHVEILEVLLEHELFPARERLHRGQTVLHLCVKHCQLDVLRFLVLKLTDLVPVKDGDGETAFDFAVRCKQTEMSKYLGKKSTAAELMRKEITGMTMVVVGLIAAMAFQATVSPPGGVWQGATSSHRAGKAVMASVHPKLYKLFSRATNTAFTSSLIVIYLVATQVPANSPTFLVVVWLATFVSMASIGMSYGTSFIMTSPVEKQAFRQILVVLVSEFAGIYAFLFIFRIIIDIHTAWTTPVDLESDHTTKRLVKLLVRMLKRRRRQSLEN